MDGSAKPDIEKHTDRDMSGMTAWAMNNLRSARPDIVSPSTTPAERAQEQKTVLKSVDTEPAPAPRYSGPSVGQEPIFDVQKAARDAYDYVFNKDPQNQKGDSYPGTAGRGPRCTSRHSSDIRQPAHRRMRHTTRPRRTWRRRSTRLRAPKGCLDRQLQRQRGVSNNEGVSTSSQRYVPGQEVLREVHLDCLS